MHNRLPRENFGVIGKIKSNVVLWGMIKLAQLITLLVSGATLNMLNKILFANTRIFYLQYIFDVLGIILTIYLILPSTSNPEKLNFFLFIHDFKHYDKNFVSIDPQPFEDINMKIQHYTPDNYEEINQQLKLLQSDQVENDEYLYDVENDSI